MNMNTQDHYFAAHDDQPSSVAPAQSSDAPLVATVNLSLSFGRQTVLKNISISIPRGQTLVLIGESGCGKTMLLKCLCGLLRPSKGEVRFDGQDLRELNEVELTKLRRRFGFVFQNAALFDSMSIAENIAFPLRQHGSEPGPQEKALIMDKLAEVGLPDNVLPKRPAQLSGGMRKRWDLHVHLSYNRIWCSTTNRLQVLIP